MKKDPFSIFDARARLLDTEMKMAVLDKDEEKVLKLSAEILTVTASIAGLYLKTLAFVTKGAVSMSFTGENVILSWVRNGTRVHVEKKLAIPTSQFLKAVADFKGIKL